VTGTPTALLAALASGLALAGCLDSDEPESTRVTGSEATVMASLPQDGVSAASAAAVEAGARLALADAGGRAGELPIRLVVRSSTEPGEVVWDPDLVSANAERAADDASTIAYLGELDYGASAVSLPITNDARILQVSPTDGLTSLTRTPPGRPRSNPVRLRPAERRSFVRLTPTDLLQAERLLGLMRADGVRRMAVLFDQEVYGRELAAQLIARARRDGPEPVGDEEYRGDVKEIPGIARNLAEGSPDAVVYAGVAGPGTGRLLAAIDARMPGVPVYGTGGLLARDPRVPIPAAPARVRALGSVLPDGELGPGARRVVERVEALHGRARARPEAVYGYEAMRLVLDAVAEGGRDRERVIDAAMRVRERTSPLGVLRIRATGDVEESRFALYALSDGSFRFTRVVP
jgi:branched-chain amino acid transport system substrate-binding protein